MFELHKIQQNSLFLQINLVDIPTEFVMTIFGTAEDCGRNRWKQLEIGRKREQGNSHFGGMNMSFWPSKIDTALLLSIQPITISIKQQVNDRYTSFFKRLGAVFQQLEVDAFVKETPRWMLQCSVSLLQVIAVAFCSQMTTV